MRKRWIAGLIGLALIVGCGGTQENGEQENGDQQATRTESWDALERDYPSFARAYERQQLMLVGTMAQVEALSELDTSYTVTATVCGKAVPLQDWLVTESAREACEAEITISGPIVDLACIEEWERCRAADVDAPCSLSDCFE